MVGPYRYPHFQKNNIEKQNESMLKKGLIRPSQSPFLSPMLLLVKKVDQTWCFCVGYHAHSSETVEDKFSILVIEELLEELYGAAFFLDLLSGYHHIWMTPQDVGKPHSEEITALLNF